MLLGERDMNFTIRGYCPGDEEEINAMFNEVFNQKRDLSHWHWKYRDNPYGAYRISLAVSEDGTLAAHFAGYPVKVYSTVHANKPMEIDTYQLGDKMTRKAYRSVGFGRSALISRTYSHFKESYMNDRISLSYGFAAHHSLRFGVTVLRYADIEPVPYRRILLDRLRGSAVGRLKKIFSPLRVTETSSIGPHWSDFFYSVAPHYECLVKRDAAYLTWRYILRPDRKYLIFSVKTRSRLTGWSVFFREGKKLIWGDSLFEPGDPESVKALLTHLSTHAIARGVDFIECWFPPRPQWWDSILDELGFEKETEPDNLHLTVPIYHDSQSLETISKYFYYSIGDSDLF